MFNRAISPWWTVASGSVSGTMNAGTVMVYAFGILTLGPMKEFGWSREVIASAFTAFLIGSGVGLAGLGWLISRFGIRAPSAVLAATAALSLVAVGVMPPSPEAAWVPCSCRNWPSTPRSTSAGAQDS